MSLPPDTVAKLNLPLSPSRVHKREGSGGKALDYIATHDAIRIANAVFGYGQWGHEVVELVQIGCDPVTSKSNKPGYKVGYRCTVRLTVVGCVPTSGVGYGDGVDYSGSMIPPHELAAKEAESDALKRALKNFGDQFGLVLYAKPGEERARVEREAAIRRERAGSAGSPVQPGRFLSDRAGEAAVTEAVVPVDDQPSLPADESPAGEAFPPCDASGDEVVRPSPAPAGRFTAPADTLKPAAQFAAGTSERKTLNLLNLLVVDGRKAGLFTTEDVYQWARDIDPMNVRDDAWYIEADGVLHWADLRSEAPVWLCSQLLDRMKLEFPAWFAEQQQKGRRAV